MNNKPLRYLIVGALGTTLALASPALAFHGGGGGGGGHGGGMGGGMHGGGMGGGMHAGGMGGGMRAGGMGGGMRAGGMGAPAHFSGMSAPSHFSGTSAPAHFSSVHFTGAPVAHAAFSPRFSRFAFRDHDGFHHGFHHHFFHHRFHRFAFFGSPYYSYASHDSCWRRVWTSYGPQWVNICGDYGY
jgi:hypothetical protein